MAIAFDARKGAGAVTGATNASLALTAAIALNEGVLVPICHPLTVLPTINSVTDDSASPNTWSVIIPPFKTAGGSQIASMLFCPMDKTALTTSNHILVSYAASANLYFIVEAFTGFVGTPTVDQNATGTGTGTAAATSSATTTQPNEVLYGHVGCVGSSTTFTVGSGFTFTGAAQGYDANCVGRGEYQLVSAAGSYAAAETLSASQAWTAMLATLYDPAAGAAAPIHSLALTGVGH